MFEPFAAHVLVSEKRAADLDGDGAGVLGTATLLFSHLLDALQKVCALFIVALGGWMDGWVVARLLFIWSITRACVCVFV